MERRWRQERQISNIEQFETDKRMQRTGGTCRRSCFYVTIADCEISAELHTERYIRRPCRSILIKSFIHQTSLCAATIFNRRQNSGAERPLLLKKHQWHYHLIYVTEGFNKEIIEIDSSDSNQIHYESKPSCFKPYMTITIFKHQLHGKSTN